MPDTMLLRHRLRRLLSLAEQVGDNLAAEDCTQAEVAAAEKFADALAAAFATYESDPI